MKLLFFNELINSDLSAAMAWTLLHSTWQGMLAAVLAGMIVIFFKKQSASLRYSLFSLVFILFLITVITTFFIQFNDQQASGNTVQQVQDTIYPITAKNTGVVTELPGMSMLGRLVTKTDLLLHQYYALLFSCWLLVFLCKLFFMLTGFGLMNRLRKESIQPVDIHWQNLVNKLCHAMGIQRQVQLLESSRIKVPMMTGFFRPVIFIPMGICCHLPPVEMEAILLHELAHIRRSDYLMNLLQRFIETVFFFNPCVLWLSSLIRDERENCCDDMAVNVISNKEQYIHALVAFQEYNLASVKTPALAFAGSRQRLLHRAKRLLMNENKKLNHMEKMILVCSMVALTAAFSISSGNLQAQNKPQRDSQHRQETNKNDNQNNDDFQRLSSVSSDNNGRRTTTITAVDEYGKKYVLRKADGKVTRLIINGKEIDENDYPEYLEIIEKIERSNAKNNNSNQNNNSGRNDNNNSNEDDVQREIQLSRDAEMLARQHRQMELERTMQLRGLERQKRALELQQQRDVLQHENRQLLQERISEKIARQRQLEMEKESGRGLKEMQLRETLEMDRRRQQLKEIEHEKMEEDDFDNERELLEHKKMELDRVLQDRKIARNQNEMLLKEQRESQLRSKGEMDQLRKEIMLETRRNQDNNDKIHNSIEDELRDLEHARVSRERALLSERKMALREQEMQQNKNLNRLRSNLNNANTNNEIQSIVEFLEERGVIDNQDKLSFTLNDEVLIVNGKKQPQSLHEELKGRFIHDDDDAFIFEKNENSTRTTINKKR